ncbi:MAG: hypothetical protein EOO43_02735 [Flavobacterium sp.]|nr:MAG: hypothetical protein EOO43_02735 [Flavobacterium sp.]
MKNLKNLLPLFALVLGLGLVITQSAFKPVKSESTTGHYYILSEDGNEYSYYGINSPNDGLCDAGPSDACYIRLEGEYMTPFAPENKPETPSEYSTEVGWYRVN